MIKHGFVFLIFALFSSLLYAGAGVDVDFGFGATFSNDDLYLRINAHYFDRDPVVVEGIAGRLRIPDRELPIVLFLSYQSRKSPDAIIQLHTVGLSWWDISVRLGVPVSAYFMELPFDPGPPYGKAYGHWNRYKTHPHTMVVLSDKEMYDLISLQVACNYFKLPPRDVIRMRWERTDFKTMYADEYRHRHAHHDQMQGDETSAKGHHGQEGDMKEHGKGHDKKK